METDTEQETQNDKLNNKDWRRVWLTRYLPLLVWVGVIFFLSSSQGSAGQTSRFIRPLLVFLFPSAPEESLLIYHGYVRKLAHVTEYAVLGFLASRAFVRPRAPLVELRAVGLAFAVAVLVAVLDETNQSFNPLRTGSPFDVLIDIAGGVVGVFFYFVITRRRLSSPSTA